MKRIIALGAVLALAACNSGPEEEPQPAPSQASAPAADSLAGTYGGNADNGQPWTSALNADGSYRNTVGGLESQHGHWTHVNDQLCFEPEAAVGEVPPQVCLKVLNVNDDGSLVLADEAGNETTAPRISG